MAYDLIQFSTVQESKMIALARKLKKKKKVCSIQKSIIIK